MATTSADKLNPSFRKKFEELGYAQGAQGKYAALDLLGNLSAPANSASQFAGTLESGRQNMVGNALNAMSPGNIQAQTAMGVDTLLNMGQAQGEQQAQRLRAQGYGDEYQQAARMSQQGTAQRQANEFQAGEGERMNKAYLNALEIIRMGQENPFFEDAMQLIQLLEGLRAQDKNRAASKDQGGLGGLGGLAGSILGGPVGGAIAGKVL